VFLLIPPGGLLDQVDAQHAARPVRVERPLAEHYRPGGVLRRAREQVAAQFVQVARSLAGQDDAYPRFAAGRHQVYRQTAGGAHALRLIDQDRAMGPPMALLATRQLRLES
jgi:hypothetical protein